MKYFDISGVIETPDNVTFDQINNEFIEFIESKGYSFGGGFGEIDEDGNEIEN